MSEKNCDVLIIGAGPAGQQAAIHAARKKATVVVAGQTDGSALLKAHVENYWGVSFAEGKDMLAAGAEQCRKFGAECVNEDVVELEKNDGGWRAETVSGKIVTAKTVVMATGTSRQKLGVPGEKELLGKGVSYCAECDAFFYRGKKTVIVGGGSAAIGAARVLSGVAAEVNVVCDKLDAEDQVREKLEADGVTVREGVKIKEIIGEAKVEKAVLDNGSEIETDGVFIELGSKGAVNMATMLGVTLDPEIGRYVLTDKKQRTNLEGLFAAGDVTGPPLQLAAAVGEGCVAGSNAAELARGGKTVKEYWEGFSEKAGQF